MRKLAHAVVLMHCTCGHPKRMGLSYSTAEWLPRRASPLMECSCFQQTLHTLGPHFVYWASKVQFCSDALCRVLACGMFVVMHMHRHDDR